MTQVPFLPVSPYLEPPMDLQPPAEVGLHTDVIFVGGGYAGLSTALRLRQAGVDVTVLEREYCGYGASGRNAGHLTPTIGKDLPTLLMMYGPARTGALVRYADYCVRHTEETMAELGISCDYNPTGNVMAVVHPNQEKRLRQAAAVAEQVGAKIRFLESDEMRQRGIPAAFRCGALEGSGGTLHPGKLMEGMRHAALQAGVKIHENTPVLSVSGGSKPAVRLSHGSVSAQHVVLATNAYTRELGWPGRRIVPLYVTLMETAPLSEEQLESIGGWPAREGIYTAHELLESYRLTAQGTIIFGSKTPRYFWGGGTRSRGGRQDATGGILEQAFQDRFPTLKDLPMTRHWAGWVGCTLNFLPSIGPLDKQCRLLHAVGFNGHGIAQAITVGNIMADRILGRRNEWQEHVERRAVPIPPEPLLGGTVRGLLQLFAALDRRTDNELRLKE